MIFMPELKCSVQTCVHNCENQCKLGRVEVKGASASHVDETCCGSFAEGKGCSCSNGTGCGSGKCEIDCKATQCMHNKGSRCDAREIHVEGRNACRSDETVCATFACK